MEVSPPQLQIAKGRESFVRKGKWKDILSRVSASYDYAVMSAGDTGPLYSCV